MPYLEEGVHAAGYHSFNGLLPSDTTYDLVDQLPFYGLGIDQHLRSDISHHRDQRLMKIKFRYGFFQTVRCRLHQLRVESPTYLQGDYATSTLRLRQPLKFNQLPFGTADHNLSGAVDIRNLGARSKADFPDRVFI